MSGAAGPRPPRRPPPLKSWRPSSLTSNIHIYSRRMPTTYGSPPKAANLQKEGRKPPTALQCEGRMAVCRLMTSLNLVDRMTGRSAGRGTLDGGHGPTSTGNLRRGAWSDFIPYPYPYPYPAIERLRRNSTICYRRSVAGGTAQRMTTMSRPSN